ncbi:hypothetical protein PR202_ga24431 [Eleusine coracana subsp. coracana]|uniref:Uncharacterized protein n=1 Tax=Eleusine coracana subsp. coracana TaxID=191504 RepID=A0AAV5D7Y1_ELECO|nr:hypothetical protein PR202_ga24431 [Eleusine coracana subsp. coracana]
MIYGLGTKIGTIGAYAHQASTQPVRRIVTCSWEQHSSVIGSAPGSHGHPESAILPLVGCT